MSSANNVVHLDARRTRAIQDPPWSGKYVRGLGAFVLQGLDENYRGVLIDMDTNLEIISIGRRQSDGLLLAAFDARYAEGDVPGIVCVRTKYLSTSSIGTNMNSNNTFGYQSDFYVNSAGFIGFRVVPVPKPVAPAQVSRVKSKK